MTLTTVTSRELNQDIGRAKRAAKTGPVVITDRGKPTLVLLSFEEYRKMQEHKLGLVERLGFPAGVEDIELDLPNSREPARYPEFD